MSVASAAAFLTVLLISGDLKKLYLNKPHSESSSEAVFFIVSSKFG